LISRQVKGKTMAVMSYRTEDGFADYGFSLEFEAPVGWRIYIGFTPVYPSDDDELRLPYQSIDDYGRRYINWPSKLDSLGDAKTVATLWAEVIHRYMQHTRERSRGASASPGTERKRASPAGLATREDGAIIQHIRFGEHDFAVLDISPEVSAVNWTADVTPEHFVSEIDRIASPLDTDSVFLQMSSEAQGTETTVSPLRRLIGNEGFNNDCGFLRIDLSPTRSVAWQTLLGNGDSFTVAGMGEETARVAVGDSKEFLGKLVSSTATSQVNGQAVISALALPLALQAGSYYSEQQHSLIAAGQHLSKFAGIR
jgi:hypothetical protein